MSRKKKFITTLASFSVLLAMLLVGVYASIIRRVDISGQITFKGEQVNATVVVEKTGLKAPGHTFVNDDYSQVGEIVGYEIGGYQGNEQNGDKFDLGEIRFSDITTKFSFRIQITSGMQGTVELQVEYQNLIKNLPTEITRTESLTIDGTSQTITQNQASFNWANITAGQIAIWTVIFEVENPASTPEIPLAKYVDETFTIKRV